MRLTPHRLLALYIAAGLIMVVLIIVWWRRRRRTLNTTYYAERWKELQKNCATRKTWPVAVIEADKLLDDALKRCGYKGKTTGERLVAAQHELKSNDAIWFGHKLCNRIGSEDVRKLKKQDVLNALTAFREALRDLGALE